MLQTNVEDYFKVKRLLKELNADLRDAKKNHELAEEIEELSKKLKKLRRDLMADQLIDELKEEIDTHKERMSLLKDIIKQEMIETETETVPFDGRVLKLVPTMKEGKDQETVQDGKGGWDKSNIEIDENVEVK